MIMIVKLKRVAAPRTWPIKRKLSKWVNLPRSGHSKSLSLPLNVILKEVLMVCRTRKEVKAILNDGKVLIDGRVVKDKSRGVGLFDVLTIKGFDNSWVMTLNDKGKLELREVEESGKKVVKVVGKQVLKSGRVQLNLHDGRNILTSEKIRVNDSLVIEVPSQKVLNHLPMKKGSKVLIIGGSHIGETAVIKDFHKFKGPQSDLVVLQKEGKSFETLLKHVVVIEK